MICHMAYWGNSVSDVMPNMAILLQNDPLVSYKELELYANCQNLPRCRAGGRLDYLMLIERYYLVSSTRDGPKSDVGIFDETTFGLAAFKNILLSTVII